MSTDNGSNTQTTQISNRFGTDISEENVRKYTDLDSKSENIRTVIGAIVLMLYIIAAVDIILPFLPIDGFFLIAVVIMFIGMVLSEILLMPLRSEKNSVGVSRESLARYEFDRAIDQYNNENYKEVMNTLTELHTVKGSNTDAITSHGKQLERYIRKLEKRDKHEQNQYIKEDFPAIVNAILAEYESRKHSQDVVSTSADRIEFDSDNEADTSLIKIYVEFLSGTVTKERLGLLSLGSVVSIGLYYLIFVSTGIEAGLFSLAILLFAVLTHFDWL